MCVLVGHIARPALHALATGVRDGVQSLPGAALVFIHPLQRTANVYSLCVRCGDCEVKTCPNVQEKALWYSGIIEVNTLMHV